MSFEDLAKDLQERAKACESVEELRALCAEQGIELSDEEIDGLAGGVIVDHCTKDMGRANGGVV